MASSRWVDPIGFRAFEHAGWQKIGKRYDESFGDLTTQAIGPLLDSVGAGRGKRLLDVATGPGYVAAAAARRGADAVGVDFSTAMVAEASRRNPDLDFREGDAESLPFPDGSFDAVVMNFGLLHLAGPEQAFVEAHRALRRAGRFAFTVWDKPEAAVGFRIVLHAVQTYGDPNVPLPAGPPFFRFSDPQECRRALVQAGFAAPDVVQVPQVWRLPSSEALFHIMLEGTVRTAGLLGAQSGASLEAIHTAVREAVGPYRKGDSYVLPMPAILASATKP